MALKEVLMNKGTIIEIKDLCKSYGKDFSLVKALDHISLTIEEGTFTAIVGASGSGKSTLLHMMGGLDTPDSGQVLVAGRELSKLSPEQASIYRRRNIGIVFQNYNLIPILNVYENIIFPIEIDGNQPDKEFIQEITCWLGIQDKLERNVTQLSGGQQQRVAIARALAVKPSILLCDEPTGNLDSRTSLEVVGLLKSSSMRFHQTIVMITHNDEIAQMADRIIHIEDGHIVGRKWGEPCL